MMILSYPFHHEWIYLKERVEYIIQCKFPHMHEELYEYKIKQLLEALVFGMEATKRWDDKLDYRKGLILMEKDGSVHEYNAYNRYELMDRLYDGLICIFAAPRDLIYEKKKAYLPMALKLSYVME